MLARLVEALRAAPQSIALADSTDPRAIRAAADLAAAGVVRPELIGERTAIERAANEALLEIPDGVSIVDTEEDPLWTALERVRDSEVDGAVVGATVTTADVLRASLKTVGLAAGQTLASSSFLFELPGQHYIAYGDCGVVPEPTAEQLAGIAIATAATFEQVIGEEARVAMLSFSTKGSAETESTARVREATKLAGEMAPDLAIDGELQFDAAFMPEIAAMKAPGSAVAGHANVFIFPNLDAGNIAYKITERLGGAHAYGPLLQGLNRPVHDLSRGCSAADIEQVATIAGYQSVQLANNN